MLCPKRHSRTLCRLSAIVLLVGNIPRTAHAQIPRDLTACTPGATAVCAQIRLIPNPSIFEIQIRTIGLTGAPLQPVSVYNLIFGTGAMPAATTMSASPLPQSIGGAVVSDPSPWDIFDSGDALFLSSLTNRGIGGCALGSDVGGFGQAANTCGAGQFVSFSFQPTRLFDPTLFQLLNFEAVVLSDPLLGASCGADGTPCNITENPRGPVTTIPEPGTVVFLAFGLLAIGAARRGRHS